MKTIIVLYTLLTAFSAYSQQYIQDGYIYDDGSNVVIQHQQTLEALGLDDNSKQIKEMNDKLDILLQRR